MIKSRSLRLWGLVVGVILVVTIVAAFAISRVSVAYAGGFVSRSSLELRVKQVQFAYDLQALGTSTHDPEFASKERRGILEQMIAERFLLREAAKQGIIITEEERQDHIVEVMSWLQAQYFGDSEESLLEELSSYDLSKAELESYLTETLEVYKLREEMGSTIEVLDADAELFYQAHSEDYNIPEMIRVSHILVTELSLAEQLLAQLKSGQDFAELASEHSIDTISAAVGGDLNWRVRGEFLPEFDEAAWALSRPGELSGLVTTTYGHHLIRLEERLAARDRSYAEVEELVKEHVKEDLEAKMWTSYLEELRTRSRIFIFIK